MRSGGNSNLKTGQLWVIRELDYEAENFYLFSINVTVAMIDESVLYSFSLRTDDSIGSRYRREIQHDPGDTKGRRCKGHESHLDQRSVDHQH